jgi:hypothetical protein
MRSAKIAAALWVAFMVACICIACAGAVRAQAAVTLDQVSAYSAADAPVPACESVAAIAATVSDLGPDVLGEVDGTRWGTCAFAILLDQSPYMACVTAYHEREHLRQWATTGRTWHDSSGLMSASLDESFAFPPCVALVPPTLTREDAYNEVYLPNVKTIRCTRRSPAALRCYARTFGGKRRVYDVLRGMDLRVHLSRMGRRNHLTTPIG